LPARRLARLPRRRPASPCVPRSIARNVPIYTQRNLTDTVLTRRPKSKGIGLSGAVPTTWMRRPHRDRDGGGPHKTNGGNVVRQDAGSVPSCSHLECGDGCEVYVGGGGTGREWSVRCGGCYESVRGSAPKAGKITEMLEMRAPCECTSACVRNAPHKR